MILSNHSARKKKSIFKFKKEKKIRRLWEEYSETYPERADSPIKILTVKAKYPDRVLLFIEKISRKIKIYPTYDPLQYGEARIPISIEDPEDLELLVYSKLFRRYRFKFSEKSEYKWLDLRYISIHEDHATGDIYLPLKTFNRYFWFYIQRPKQKNGHPRPKEHYHLEKTLLSLDAFKRNLWPDRYSRKDFRKNTRLELKEYERSL